MKRGTVDWSQYDADPPWWVRYSFWLALPLMVPAAIGGAYQSVPVLIAVAVVFMVGGFVIFRWQRRHRIARAPQ